MVKGTLRYMSPEQVMQGELDGRSDLFAASAVLYELLSGRRAFDDDSDAALLGHIVKADVRPLREVAPDVSPKLAEVVMKGLARAPDDRWPSGRVYARALDQALDLFDEEQVAALMARLFEDKISITRGLLQSTSTDATYANLKLMAQTSDEGDSKPSLREPAAPSPEGQRRRATAESPSATIVVDEPVRSTERTEANLEAVPTSRLPTVTPKEAPSDRPTTPEKPVVGQRWSAEEATVAEGRRRTLDGQPAARKPPSGPSLPRSTDPAGGPEATVSEVSTPKPATKELKVPRRQTAEAKLSLEPVTEHSVEATPGSNTWLLVVLLALGLVVAGGLALIVMTKPPPEAPVPLEPLPLRPGPPPRPR
jgi:serine/threonine-protein kinase